MHFSASLAALSAAAILVQPISAAPTEEQGHGLSMRALGINCRGSPNCIGNHLNFVAGAISKINMDKTYNNGDHIACLRHPNNDGECAFLQGTQSGLQGSRIKDLIGELQRHGCKGCGSVPINFPQSNDPSPGILTVNYVSDVGECKADDGVCDASRLPTTDIFEWAAMGDSWSSGVSYSSKTRYKDSATCYRTNEAWGAQMEDDSTWTEKPQHFRFAACAGDKLNNLTTNQIVDAGNPQLIVSTAGGNNAFFGQNVDDCIYHGTPTTDYGPPYDKDPEGKGACKKSLKKTQDYIDNTVSGLSFDLKRTLDDLFAADLAKSRPDLHVYFSSYARFFNADSDTCNKLSFAKWWQLWKPLLVKELRKEFNDKVDGLHKVYSTVIGSYNPPTGMRLGFISVNEGFEGHRFCEPNHSEADQWGSEDVWFWNLRFTDPANGGEAQLGQFQTDQNGTSYMGQQPGESESDYQDYAPAFSPGGDGWMRRPFHPRKPGYTKMKDLIIQKLKADKVPGIKV